MIISLTDESGIKFDVNPLFIDTVQQKGYKTELILITGERVECKESASLIMKAIVDSKFKRS